MQGKKIDIRIFSSGYCTANIKHVFPAEPSRKIRFHATWALIHHPELNYILFDTGYSNRFFDATLSFPNRIYRWVTPVFHKEEESCLNKLANLNIEPGEIGHVIVSHFHGDHIAGLKDFPESKIWCSKSGLDYSMTKKNIAAVFSGILKPLIPDDIRERAKYPEEEFQPAFLENLKAWQWTDDMWFVDLPGHFRGQLGLFLKNTNMGDVLLCADAAWSIKAIWGKIYPSRMVYVFIDNYSMLTETIDQLQIFHSNNQEVKILACHCKETLNLIQN